MTEPIKVGAKMSDDALRIAAHASAPSEPSRDTGKPIYTTPTGADEPKGIGGQILEHLRSRLRDLKHLGTISLLIMAPAAALLLCAAMPLLPVVLAISCLIDPGLAPDACSAIKTVYRDAFHQEADLAHNLFATMTGLFNSSTRRSRVESPRSAGSPETTSFRIATSRSAFNRAAESSQVVSAHATPRAMPEAQLPGTSLIGAKP